MISTKARTVFRTINCFKSRVRFTSQYIIKSKVNDTPVPEVTLDQYVWKNIDKWHDKTAITCAETGRNYSFSDVHNRSNSLANFLHKFPNLPQGSMVAIVLPNIPEYPIVVMGSIQAGLKVTTVNPAYTRNEMLSQLENSQAKIIFTLPKLYPKVCDAIKTIESDISVVTINHASDDSTPSGTIKFSEMVTGSSKIEFNIQRSPDDVILLPYSSGTTGLPKGVPLTHKNIISALFSIKVGELNLNYETTSSYQDSSPFIIPMFHIYGMFLSLTSLSTLGTKMVSFPSFTTEMLLDVLVKHRPTFAYLVPPLVQLLINHPQVQYDHITSLEKIVSGAAPLRQLDIIKLNEKSRYKICLLQGYGLTENSGVVAQQIPYDFENIVLGGSGYVVCNTEVKVIAPGLPGVYCLPHQGGEILVRGPQLMKEYYNNVEATREAFDADGWFYTGDFGYYDDDGQLFITDRIKDLIKVKGYQVAPAELEAVLRNHPNIGDVAVIGVPDNKFGEVPKAFIVPKKHSSSLIFDIHKFMAGRVANYKQLLGGIVIIPEIPRNASGKILRRILKDM